VLWRQRLEAYINDTSHEALDAEIVGVDGHCALGEWLHGEGGEQFSDHPKFSELQQAHACFHKYAGEVIRCKDNGDSHKARELLKGDYSICSQKVKMNLARLSVATTGD
jgi:hypothetical protein